MPLVDPHLISQSYESKLHDYQSLSKKVESLIFELLSIKKVQIHSINSRVKDIDSLTRKCIKKSKYNSVDDVTDIVGVRIITLMESEIDKVAEIIEGEFKVDIVNSIDKRAAIDPEKFGYLSLHYVAELTNDRLGMTEYALYNNLKFEIQIRSILQHAWAEIEHDLGYKAKNEIPKPLRRKFSQAASLLEVADQHFNEIRLEITRYIEEVSKNIQSSNSGIQIDLNSVDALIESPLVKETENYITSQLDFGVSNTISQHMISRLIESGFNSIEEITRYYFKNIETIKKFTLDDYSLALGTVQYFSTPKGFTLYSMCTLKAYLSGVDMEEYLGIKDADDEDYLLVEMGQNTISALKSLNFG